MRAKIEKPDPCGRVAASDHSQTFLKGLHAEGSALEAIQVQLLESREDVG